MENAENIPAKENVSANLEPIGPRIIGKLNPKNLTEDEFKKAPELLFHGAPEFFNFSSKFDYNSSEYCEQSDGSQTLGVGFYTTAEKDVAENYSLVRQHHSFLNKVGQEVQPVVDEILAYQAKMLDLRAKTDLTKTAPVTEEFFQRWCSKFLDYYQKSLTDKNLAWYTKSQLAKYQEYLIKFKELKPELDLRLILATKPRGKLSLPIINMPSPPWMELFSTFMIDEGYDGLVYIEGGEGLKAKSHSSYVFYNLEKVGTYQSWQESPVTASASKLIHKVFCGPKGT